ncbi:MAG TPA: HEAT repeat domain-containing protein [Dehalococcoidia bacterium]|nr:HEAT repeat domain-containing protein [Dehalococcoidia bacterium]
MEFSEYLAELKDPSARLSVAGLQQLASLERGEAAALRSAWPQIGGERRRQVVHQLMELAEDNVDLNFDAVFFAALDDEAAAVRADAVRGLWEYEGRDLIAPLLRLLAKDEEPEVRAEAALALGRFVVLSEAGSLGEEQFQQVEAGLRRSLEDELEVDEVRGRALEAIGASGRPWVEQAMEHAYESEAPRLRVSAIHAMGRSCDGHWLPVLIEELENDDPEIRYEAATALGALADRRVVAHLAPLLRDPDLEVREAAIAALGQIGGSEAKLLLRPLLRDPSPSMQEAAAAAVAEADFDLDPLSVEYEL